MKNFLTNYYNLIKLKSIIKDKYKNKIIDNFSDNQEIKNNSVLYNHLKNDTEKLSIEVIKDKLGKRWKFHLKQITDFINIYKDNVPDNIFNHVEISTTSRCFESLGSVPTVSSIIRNCEKLSLLKCIDRRYCFTGEYSCSRKYFWNRNIEKQIICIADLEEIDVSKEKEYHNLRYYESLGEKTRKRYRKDTDVKKIIKESLKKTYIGKKISFDYIDDGAVWNNFFNNYGFVKSYMKMIERNNNKEDDENNKDILRLKIKRTKDGKKVKSLSLRMFNNYCSMKKTVRESILTEDWGGFYCYDMNGSIYRITNGINKKIIDLNTNDIYAQIFDEKELNKDFRKKVKSIMMNLYFCSTYKEARNTLFYIGMNRNDMYLLKPEYRNEFLKDLEYLKKKMLQFKREFIEKYEKTFIIMYFNLRNKIGASWNSEIFLHESCIYSLVKNELLRKGYRCVLIYDAFYVDKLIDEDSFKRLIERCARKYFKRLQKWIARRKEQIEKKFEKRFNNNKKTGLTFNKRVNRFIRKNVDRSYEILDEHILECIDDILKNEKIRELYKIVLLRFVFRPFIMGKILNKKKDNKKLCIEKYVYDT